MLFEAVCFEMPSIKVSNASIPFKKPVHFSLARKETWMPFHENVEVCLRS
jgi:hypothetical protein